MLAWLSANIGTILITLVLIVIVVGISVYLIKQKENRGQILLRSKLCTLRNAWQLP